MAEKPVKTYKDVQSVKRALDILEAVSAAGEMRVTEIASAVGLHVATTHNILRTLSRYRYLENCNSRYRLGAAVALLSGCGDMLAGLQGLLQPRMERISSETGEAASASVLSGEVLQIVAFQPGTHAVTIHFPQKIWPQPLSLASGRLLVSELPEEDWESYISDDQRAEAKRIQEDWISELREIRKNGCSVIMHGEHGGQVAIVLPVCSRSGKMAVAIGASAPLFRGTPQLCEKMFTTIRDIAVELSKEFGCPDSRLKGIRKTAMPDWDSKFRAIIGDNKT